MKFCKTDAIFNGMEMPISWSGKFEWQIYYQLLFSIICSMDIMMVFCLFVLYKHTHTQNALKTYKGINIWKGSVNSHKNKWQPYCEAQFKLAEKRAIVLWLCVFDMRFQWYLKYTPNYEIKIREFLFLCVWKKYLTQKKFWEKWKES